MITARHFKDTFSGELNECNENLDDGVFYTIRRFEQFIITLNDKIDEDNRNIIENIKNEEEDVAISMLSQFDTSNSLHYFGDTILKSFVVSIYSYFEYKMNQFSHISETYLPINNRIDKFKKIDKIVVSDIEKYNAFLISEIIPDLKDYEPEFEKIKIWKYIRKLIVHDNSNVNETRLDLSAFSSIQVDFEKIKIIDNKDVIDFLSLIENYLHKIVDLINVKYNLIEYIKINNNA